MPVKTENRIKILRKAHKLSQSDFAKLFSVDQTAVSNWENSKNSIDMNTADRIADFFHVPVEFVYGKSYHLSREKEKWNPDEKEQFIKASNEEERIYLEFVFGRGVFEGSGTVMPERTPSEDEIKIALFGGEGDVSDEDWDEVKKFVEFIKSKKDR